MNLNTLRLYLKNLTSKVDLRKLKKSADEKTRRWLKNNLSLIGRDMEERHINGLLTITEEVEDDKEIIYGTGVVLQDTDFSKYVAQDDYTYKGEIFQRDINTFTYSDDGIFLGMSHTETDNPQTLTYSDNAYHLTGYASLGEYPYRHASAATPEAIWRLLEIIEGKEGPYLDTFRHAKSLTTPYGPDGGIVVPDADKLKVVDEINPIDVDKKPERIPELPFDRKWWYA
jgi:hypothetical protein